MVVVISNTYDSIGFKYAQQRRPDPRIAARLLAALGDARWVLNVGAGAGSYEPRDRHVVALEPSGVMLAQRAPGAAPAVQGCAEALPFLDQAFDAVMAVLTVHHWTDRLRGLSECMRVARSRIVLLTWDPASPGFWLVQDYLSQIVETDRRLFPSIDALLEVFGSSARIDVTTVPVPRDCVDGFLGAFWARPEAYLNPAVRAGMSAFARQGLEPGLRRLRAELESGAWQAKYDALLAMDTFDMGYRMVTADVSRCTR